MRLGCALLCDAAVVREGLLNILSGGLDRVTYEAYPARLDTNVALLIILEGDEMDGEHRLNIRIGFAGGERLAELTGRFVAQRPSPDVAETKVPLPVGIDLPLPRPGAYAIDVTFDGDLIATLPFDAVEGAPPPTFPSRAAAAS